MNTLVLVALEWLKKFLLSKLAINKIFATVVALVLDMINEGYLAFTDNVADNKLQLKQIWQRYFVPLLGGVLAGATFAIKSEQHKQQIIAVLEDALTKLKNDEPTFSEI